MWLKYLKGNDEAMYLENAGSMSTDVIEVNLLYCHSLICKSFGYIIYIYINMLLFFLRKFFIFFIFAFTHAGGVNYLYSFLSHLPIPNHIFIYSTCPHIFPNNPHPLLLYSTSASISLYSYFTYFLDYILIIFSLNLFKPYQSILFHFPEYVRYT